MFCSCCSIILRKEGIEHPRSKGNLRIDLIKSSVDTPHGLGISGEPIACVSSEAEDVQRTQHRNDDTSKRKNTPYPLHGSAPCILYPCSWLTRLLKEIICSIGGLSSH